MSNKQKRLQNIYDFTRTTLSLTLIAFTLRFWPVVVILLMIVFGSCVYGCWVWIFDTENQDIPLPNTHFALPSPKSSYKILCRQIDQHVKSISPVAKWTWLTPCPISAMHHQNVLQIRLYNSTGYKTAYVYLRNNVFDKLQVAKSPANPPSSQDNTPQQDDTRTDYSLMAYQWVESQITSLIENCNDAIAEDHQSLYLPATILPDKQSWSEISKVLFEQGFENELDETGITICLKQKGA